MSPSTTCWMYWSFPKAVSSTTRTPGATCRIWRAASIPFNRGIPISMRITSGRSATAISIAFRPFSASPTTRIESSVERTERSASRMKVWSSAIPTESGLAPEAGFPWWWAGRAGGFAGGFFALAGGRFVRWIFVMRC